MANHLKAPTFLPIPPERPESVTTVRYEWPFALRPEDAAAYLSLNRNDIHAFIKSGDLTPVRFGKRTLILRPDLESLMERLAAKAMAA